MRSATTKWTAAVWIVRLLAVLCCWSLILAGSIALPTRAEAAVNLSLTKSANVSLATPGSLLYFKLIVKNHGDAAATNVILTDRIPVGCTFVSATLGGVLSNGLCAWNLGSLAPGASVEVFLHVKLNLGLLLAAITNTAQVTCPQLPAPVNSNTVSIGISLGLLPSLSLTKSVNVSTAAPGGLATFTLTAKNNGVGAATNVVLTDPIPSGCTPVSATGGGQILNGVCTWNLGSLAAGASVQVQLQVKINVGVTGAIQNIARIACSQQGTPAESNSCIITIKVPKLVLAKSVSVSTAIAGQLVTYAIVATNNGEYPATNVVITDPLPAGCSPVTISTGGLISGQTCTWKIPTLAVGASVKVTVQVKIGLGILGLLRNIAIIGCTELPDPGNSNPSDCEVVPPPPPSLVCTKKASVYVTGPGGLVTFTLAVKNSGGTTATNVVLKDQLAQGLSFESASNGGTHSNGLCTWNLGSIAAGATVQVTVKVKVTLTIAGIITNVAQVNCTEVPTLVLSNVISLKVEALRLSLSKAVNLSLAAPGSLLTFTLTVKNLGPGNATNVVLTDPLPNGCTPLILSHGGSSSNGVCTWNLGDLATGASVQVTVQVKLGLEIVGTITNQARAICSELTIAVLSNKVSIKIGLPSLSLSKVVNLNVATPGSLLSFTITLKNVGYGTATNCKITDLLPAGLTVVSLSGGGILSGSTCSWNVGDLLPGASVQVIVQVKLNLGIVGTITNQAKAICTEILAGVLSNKVTVSIALPNLALSKVVNVATALPGSLLSYTITLKNTGTGTATNCKITDQLPAGLTAISLSTGGLLSGSTCSWNVGDLAPGATVQVTVQVKVGLLVLGLLTNVAKVGCAELVDIVASNGAVVKIGLL